MNNDIYGLDKLFADDPEMQKILDGLISAPAPKPEAQPPQQAQPYAVPIPAAMPASNRIKSLDEIINELNAELSLSPQPLPEISIPPVPAVDEQRTKAQPIMSLDDLNALFGESPTQTRTLTDPLSEIKRAQPPSKKRSIGRLVFNCMFYILIFAILGGAVLFTVSGNTQKSYFGYRLYTVKTPSMTPQPGGLPGGFRAGDTILVKMCDPKTIQVNDVITYVPGSDPNTYLTHRVVNVLDHLNDDQGLFFVTKGDANPSDDPPIAAKAMVGKVVAVIPSAGGVIEFIRSHFILCVVSIVSAIGSIILLRMYFSDPNKKKQKSNARTLLPA